MWLDLVLNLVSGNSDFSVRRSMLEIQGGGGGGGGAGAGSRDRGNGGSVCMCVRGVRRGEGNSLI